MNIYEVLNEIFKSCSIETFEIDFRVEFREKLNNEKEKKLFDLIKNISSLHINYRDRNATFQPMLVYGNRRSFSLEDITEENLLLIKELDLNKLPLILRAKIADVIWELNRDYNTAKIAVKSYKELFNSIFNPVEWTDCFCAIYRAMSISSRLGKNENLYIECCEEAYMRIKELDGKDNLFLSLKLIEMLMEQKCYNSNSFLIILDKIIMNSAGNIRKVEMAFELKVKLLKMQNNMEVLKQTYIDWAEFLEIEADKCINNNICGLFNAEKYLIKAIKIYRNNKMSEDSDRLQKKLYEIQKKIPQKMIPISNEVDLSKTYSMIMSYYDDLSFEEHILRLVQSTIFMSKDYLKKSVVEEARGNFLSSLLSKNIINKSGQTIIHIPPLDRNDPEKDVKVLEMHMHQKAMLTEGFYGETVLKWGIEKINKSFKFSENDIAFLTKDNCIIPNGRENVFAFGIYLGLTGRYYEALHILAPQVENLFRNIAREAGGLTVTLDDTWISKEKALSSIFDIPELVDCYDNDILFLFKGILNEKSGANIRNNIAHGILDENIGNGGVAVYFICAVIKILSFTSNECFNILKNSTKLKQGLRI